MSGQVVFTFAFKDSKSSRRYACILDETVVSCIQTFFDEGMKRARVLHDRSSPPTHYSFAFHACLPLE